MDNFKVIYKILKYLESSLDYSETDLRCINATALKITEERWEQLMIMLYQNGYIDGITICKSVNDYKYHIVEPIKPVITLKGLEYLADNTMMKKASRYIQDIKNIIR